MVKRVRSLVPIAALVLLSAAASQSAIAVPMMKTLPLILDGPTIPPVYNIEPTGPQFTVEVPRFDNALGKLVQVDLFHSWSWTVGYGLDSQNNQPTEIRVFPEVFVTLPDGTLLATQSAAPRSKTVSSAFGFSEGFDASVFVSLTAEGVISQFAGSGVLGLLERSDWTVQVVSGPGSSQGGANASNYVDLLEVTYYYNESVAGIPEPPIWSLVLFGLAGFAGIGYTLPRSNKVA